jgi:hypothetical protein
MQEYFRDVSDHLQRLNQTIESIRETVSTAISVNLSMITLQESEAMKRLAAYAALIAVPTMIVGIYGMNFDNMPELHWHYGYAIVLGAMSAIDVYIFYRLRKAKWLWAMFILCAQWLTSSRARPLSLDSICELLGAIDLSGSERLTELPIFGKKGFDNVRNKGFCIDWRAPCLRVERSVAIDRLLERCRNSDSQPHCGRIRQRSEAEVLFH